MAEGFGVEDNVAEMALVHLVTERLDDHAEDVPGLIQGEHDHQQHVAAQEGAAQSRNGTDDPN